MEGLALSVVVGLRPAEAGEDPGLLDQIVADPLATVIRPAPLSPEATVRFLPRPSHPPPTMRSAPPATRRQAAIRYSCASSCTRSPSRGSCRRRATCPACASSRRVPASRAVSLRLAWLPPEATRWPGRRGARRRRRSAPGRGARRPRRTRCVRGGRGPRRGSTCSRSQQPLGFVHPLIRAAVYDSLTQLERERRSRAGCGAPGRRGRRAGARRRAAAS